MHAPRKSVSELNGNEDDMQKALDNIEEAMNFAVQLLLSSAKNMGMPGDDSSSSQAQEMSMHANSIAQMMSTKASVKAQMQLIQAQKNPA